MAAVQRELRDVAAYLGVSCGKITVDGTVPVLKGKAKGLTTILKCLARDSKNTSLFGKNAEDQAAIDQWLEYRVVYLDRCASDKDVAIRLNELNTYIRDKVYFVGNCVTLADIVIFQAVHKLMANMTFYDKENVIHLSRWFDHIQHTPELRQSLAMLVFSRTLLYH